MWDTPTQTSIREFHVSFEDPSHRATACSCAVLNESGAMGEDPSSSGKLIGLCHFGSESVSLFDLRTANLTHQISHTFGGKKQRPIHVRSPLLGGKGALLSATEEGQLHWWDFRALSVPSQSIDLHSKVSSLSCRNDLVIAGTSDGFIAGFSTNRSSSPSISRCSPSSSSSSDSHRENEVEILWSLSGSDSVVRSCQFAISEGQKGEREVRVVSSCENKILQHTVAV